MINKRFFKVINRNIDKYHTGLNISTNKDLFCFTTCNHIHKFLHQGVEVVELFLPVNFIDNTLDFKIIYDDDFETVKSNVMVLGKTYSLFDVSTYDKIQLDMNNCDVVNEIAVFASFHNKLHILDWLLKNYNLTVCDEKPVDTASCVGNIQVLQWWFDSGLEFKYSCRSLDLASRNNQLDALTWWLKSGINLSYSVNAINAASMNGHTDTLNWWLKSGLSIIYNEFAFDFVIFNNDIETAKWWIQSGLVLKFSMYALKSNKHSDVVKLLKSNLINLNYICYDYGF